MTLAASRHALRRAGISRQNHQQCAFATTFSNTPAADPTTRKQPSRHPSAADRWTQLLLTVHGIDTRQNRAPPQHQRRFLSTTDAAILQEQQRGEFVNALNANESARVDLEYSLSFAMPFADFCGEMSPLMEKQLAAAETLAQQRRRHSSSSCAPAAKTAAAVANPEAIQNELKSKEGGDLSQFSYTTLFANFIRSSVPSMDEEEARISKLLAEQDDGAAAVSMSYATPFSDVVGEQKRRLAKDYYDSPLPQTLQEAMDSAQSSLQARVITKATAPFDIVFVNPAWERLCGYTLEECRGKTLSSLLHGPDTNAQAASSILMPLLQGQTAGTTLVNYRKNGTSFTNRLRVGPLRSSDKEDSDQDSNASPSMVTHFLGVLLEVEPFPRNNSISPRAIG